MLIAAQRIDADVTFKLSPLQSTLFRVNDYMCLAHLRINGIALPSLCRYGKPYDIELAPYLHGGKNTLQIVIIKQARYPTAFDIYPSPHDPVLLWVGLTAILLIASCAFELFRTSIGREQYWLTNIFALGMSLRVVYVFVTVFWLRSYDMDGHFEYIRFMLSHFSVPPATLGWETHQPPLYYLITAVLLGISHLAAWSDTQSWDFTQQLSLWLSVASLGVSMWIGTLLFRKESEWRELLIFGTMMAAFPLMIEFSSRINNDILSLFLAVNFLGCLLLWWRDPTLRRLLIASLVISLGFLTKANAYLFIPILWVCISLRPDVRFKKKLQMIALSAVVIATVSGWLLALRYFQHDFIRLFTYGNGMHFSMNVPTTWKTFLLFNPLHVLLQPYVDTRVDATGRAFFWVFFFKSSLFGEFTFPVPLLISRIVAGLTMGTVGLCIIGFFHACRRRSEFIIPMVVTTTVLLAGAIAYRGLHPSAGNQDFRFSILLLLPLAWLALQAKIPGRFGQAVTQSWIVATIISYVTFIVMLVV